MFPWEAVNAIVHDIRDNEDTVSLDTTGFEFIQHSGGSKSSFELDIATRLGSW